MGDPDPCFLLCTGNGRKIGFRNRSRGKHSCNVLESVTTVRGRAELEGVENVPQFLILSPSIHVVYIPVVFRHHARRWGCARWRRTSR